MIDFSTVSFPKAKNAPKGSLGLMLTLKCQRLVVLFFNLLFFNNLLTYESGVQMSVIKRYDFYFINTSVEGIFL